jgi:hypothetical protein
MWINLGRDPFEQVRFLLEGQDTADYFLTQIVSHHRLEEVDRFLEVFNKEGVRIPGMVGIFHYRSANPQTLGRLKAFLPVPAEELTREFTEEGISAHEVTARTLRALHARGVSHTYVSNLTPRSAARDIRTIESLARVVTQPSTT